MSMTLGDHTIVRRVCASVAVVTGWILLSGARPAAQSGQSNIAPSLSLSANGKIEVQAFQGSPLIFQAALYHPNLYSRHALVIPLPINAQNGSWANTVHLVVTDSSGTTQNWPAQMVTIPAGPLSLDQTNEGTLSWVVAPSATASIAPGTYTAIATIDTTASAGTTGWKGQTSSYSASIEIGAAPATPTPAQSEEQAALLATYDDLLGNDAQAVADLDRFLPQQPDSVRALELKGRFLEHAGETDAALDAYDQAVDAFFAANPGPLDEQPVELLESQGRARSKLLSQSGQAGTPQVEIRLQDQGVQSPGVFFLDLQITNVGNDVAENVVLSQLVFQPSSGTGQVMFNNVLSAKLPLSTDLLDVNGSTTVRLFVSAQGQVDSFSLTEHGTTADIFGTPYAFSQTQTISGDFSGSGGGGGGNPGPLIIAAPSATQVYGQSTPNLTNVSYVGFVNGDGPHSLSGALSCMTTATATSPVGTYPIVCSGLSSPNYTITFIPGTLAITPASLVVTANSTARQYGQANPAFAASFNGFVNGDGPSALTGTLSCVTTATPASAVSGSPYLIICSGLNSTNYNISYALGMLDVRPASLTITAEDASRSYGQPNPTFTAHVAGFVNGDDASVLAGSLSCTSAATLNSPPGSYPIDCSGVDSNNYTVTYVAGQLSVAGGAALTVTAASASRRYGQANPSLAASFNGFISGDGPSVLTGALSCATTATASSPAGSYPINCSGLSSATYSISYVAGQLTVTPAPLSITANNATRPSGQVNPALSASFSGFVNGETPSTLSGSLSCTTTATTNSPAGNYPITCAGLSSANYAIAYVAGQLTVTPGAACAANAGTPVLVAPSGFSYSILTKRYAQTVTLRNATGAPISGPIFLVLDNLSAGATLLNGSGHTTCAAPSGSPYVSVPGGLAAGASATVVLQFTNPSNAAIAYTSRVLSGAGQP